MKKYCYLDGMEDKTEDKVETIPFKRREKRDVSLSQITKDPINLETSYKNLNHIRNNKKYYIFPLQNKKQSFFVKRLLSEILPEKKNINENNSKLKTKSIPKPKRISKEKNQTQSFSEQKTLEQSQKSNNTTFKLDYNCETIYKDNKEKNYLPNIEKKIIFNDDNNKNKTKIKKKKMKKSFSEQKLYKKNCEIKNHQYKKKFIEYFLTPFNSFINKDFNLFTEEYDNINNEISQKIQNNRKNIKKFLPPKIPFIYSNYKYYFNGINYKFKI